MSTLFNKKVLSSFVSTADLSVRLRVPHCVLVDRVLNWIDADLPASMRDLIRVDDDRLLIDASLFPAVDAEFSLVCH